ncbi:hypothetical protein GGH17_000704 [Coemansia sp. RSA 788]|nr:hypothetical protein GGH17_000704 [Coemansia sp. RSA 788]KAJ2176018.1 hypothetical protein GGH16_000390 [Coemansia sp. RSA 560]
MSGDSWQYVLAGVVAAVAAYRVLSHMLEQSAYELEFCRQAQRRRQRRNGQGSSGGTAATIRAESLGKLALHADYRLRRAATDVLYDSAAGGRVARLAVTAAVQGSDVERRCAVTLLQALAQSAGRQRRLARAGAIEALVTCVGARDKELVLRAASALAEFVGHEDGAAAARFRQRAAAAGILSVVASVLERDTDAVVVTVNANIARVYAQRTQFHGEMVRRGYLAALLRVARRAGADVELQRVVMESMVRLCTYLGGADTGTMQLEKLLQGGAADVVAACVRRDDQGVASWGIGLLHEFVSRGVGTLMLARRAGLVRALCRRLSTAKYAYTNQLVLRSLLCLGSASRVAMAEIAEPPNLRRILAVFAIEDADAHHWGIALVARAAAHVHTHVWILGSPLPRALRDMATRLPQSMRATLLPEIANIISRMCHSAALAPAHAAHDELAETCRLLMASDIENAHLAAIMAIINAAATSRAFVRLVVTDRVRVQLLDMLVDFSHDVTQSYAAKGLAALLPCALVSPDTLVFSGTVPFLQGVCTRYADALDMDSDGSLAGNENRAVNIGRTNAVASVLLSVMPIFLATETRDRGHALAAVRTDDAYVALFSFQTCLLAHMALCLKYVLKVNVPRSDSNTHAMRQTVNAFIIAYYADDSEDPHGRAAAADWRVLKQGGRIRHAARMASTGNDSWPRDEWPSADSVESDNDNTLLSETLKSARVRCVFLVLQTVLGVLGDSLEPALVVQHPAVARQALQLLRIICSALPALRGTVMRVLGCIDVRVLTPGDAIGLMKMCASYVADPTYALPPDAAAAHSGMRAVTAIVRSVEDQPRSRSPVVCRQSRIDWAADDTTWQASLPPYAGAAADGERDHSSYSERFPECDSANISAFGRVHAQFALDRHATGWRTAADLYACVEPAGHTHWVVDRSGPRGSGLDIEPTVVLRSLRQPLADGAQSPAPSRPSSSPAVDADDTHRSPRPPSPFPSPSADDTATPPLPSSLLPATQFHTYTPFYPSFIALADGHTIWNSSWKFESARTRTGVDGRLGGIHRFHVRLLTSGLIQIGWCSNKCGFYPESGEGVGDDYESIAYDGHRQRKWFGTAEDTKYGEKWHAGDVVTAELDLDNGRVVFYLNGRSMGLAFGINEQGAMEGAESGFQGLSRDRTWYPAFSFATEQGLVFLGDGADQQSQRLGVLPHIADSRSSRDGSDDGNNIVPVERLESDELDSENVSSSDLRALGVVHASRIRFEFQDLDSFPCISLCLPGTNGQIIIGPVTEPESLSTYLQPQWWAVWTTHTDDVRDASPLQLRRLFADAVSGRSSSCVQSCALTQFMDSSLWVYCVVLTDGRVCLAVLGDDCQDAEPSVVFDTGAASKDHIWLPTASPAVVRFNLQSLCT